MWLSVLKEEVTQTPAMVGKWRHINQLKRNIDAALIRATHASQRGDVLGTAREVELARKLSEERRQALTELGDC